VLDGLPEIPVCVEYKINGKRTAEIPAQASGYQNIECIYEKMPGWQKSTEGITEWDKLPARARAYLSFIEKESRARIGIVSTGPGREQTMYLEDFSAELERKSAAAPNTKGQSAARSGEKRARTGARG
jgi:adenylosuccinate synthase